MTWGQRTGSSAEVLEFIASTAAGAALVRDGELESRGLVDREEALWVARALGSSSHATFELTVASESTKRIRWLDVYEITSGTALVVVRDGSRPLEESQLDRALGSLRKSRGPGLAAASVRDLGAPSAGALFARRR